MYNRGSVMNVFISHAPATTRPALDLSRALRSHGVGTFLALEDLKPGDSMRSAHETALRSADGIVFLVDPASTSGWGQPGEWMSALEAAWERPKTVLIPVLLGDAEAPPFLRDRLALRLDNPPGSSDRLASRVLTLLRRGRAAAGAGKSRRARERARRSARLREIKGYAAGLRNATL